MATLAFDFDGVLVRSRYSADGFYWSQNIERDLGITKEAYTEIFAHEHWHPCIAGRAELRPHLERVLSKHAMRLSADEFIRYWLESDVNWYPAMLETLRELKRDGHLLVLATNQDSNRGRFIKSLEPIRELFEDVVSSGDLGHMKPDPKYFELATERIAKRSDHNGPIAFIDDRKANIETARACGWLAFHYDPDLSGTTLDELKTFLSTLQPKPQLQ